jgi:DNA-binding CsgD family transcriptional regulator
MGSMDRPTAARLAFRGRVDEARELLRGPLALAEERGQTRFRAVLTLHACEVELRAGDTREAERLLDDWAEAGALEGLESAHARCHALLAALQGRPDDVERWAKAAGPTEVGEVWDMWDELEAARAKGIAALHAREPERAAEILSGIWQHTRREGVDDPGVFPVAPDLVEALVWLERIDDADAVTRELGRLAEQQDHPWGLAAAARCAAVVRLTAGYDEAAAARLAGAADRFGDLGLGFDRARALLLLGREARRARKRAAAREALELAAAQFGALGSAGWADQARAELDLLGARGAAAPGELTPAEQRVVELAAAGLSNKQIARRLFVTVHTVEVHLAHSYVKLGVRSRAQLASQLASAAAPSAADRDPDADADPARRVDAD